MPLALWSITEIDHLGNTFCYSHDIDKEQIIDHFKDIQSELDPKDIKQVKVYKHYDFCCYCHWSLRVGIWENESF